MLVQVFIILFAAWALVQLLRPLGQPPVIGEMAAGFVLGPVVFGALMPEWHQRIFAPEHLGEVTGLGQLGLVFFMFLIGAELRLDERGARRALGAAARLAVLSFAIPFALGLAIAPLLHESFAPAGISFWPFALFVGTALSVTALPVMARILKERDMAATAPGVLALQAAALGDVAAWLMLAMVVAAVKPQAHGMGLGFTVLLLVLLVAVVFGVLRPLLARRFVGRPAGEELRAADIPVLLAGALACAYATELLHVHAAFGAFLFGLALPREARLEQALRSRIEPLVLLVLMPCFFALAGLRTTDSAFAPAALAIFALIMVVAVAGKVAAGVAGARWAGQSWRDSLTVGALMNTRGVVELIFLKVGLDAGLIGPELFTLLFLTALATTLMTGPWLALLRNGVSSEHPHPQRP